MIKPNKKNLWNLWNKLREILNILTHWLVAQADSNDAVALQDCKNVSYYYINMFKDHLLLLLPEAPLMDVYVHAVDDIDLVQLEVQHDHVLLILRSHSKLWELAPKSSVRLAPSRRPCLGATGPALCHSCRGWTPGPIRPDYHNRWKASLLLLPSAKNVLLVLCYQRKENVCTTVGPV